MKTFTLIRTRDFCGINKCTRGMLIEGGRLICYTMEPEYVHKESGVSGSEKAILAGEYEVEWTKSERFKRLLPELKRVPGRSGIRMHIGNIARETSGCILVGVESITGGNLVHSAAGLARFARFAPKDEKFKLVIVNAFDPEETGDA